MTINKYDVKIINLLLREKNIRILYLVLVAIWLQFGLEWIASVKDGSYESFLRYEPSALVMSAPVGIIVLVIKHTFNISDIRMNMVMLWSGYFLSSIIQVSLIAHVCKKRKLRRANSGN
jgi:hypothetical protein